MSDHDAGIKINISELISAVEKHLGHKEVILDKLNIAFQAIAKRKRYCQYHFELFKESTSSVALLKDRFEQVPNNEFSVRDVYEANSIAFLQNLHAMIDSFPYAINIIYQGNKDIESRRVGWNKEFIKLYKDYEFFPSMKKLYESKMFCLVKGYSNHGKHKHPIRIRNTIKDLTFEDFTYEYSGKKHLSKELKVEDFMMECHDKLIPEFFHLINRVQEGVSRSSL